MPTDEPVNPITAAREQLRDLLVAGGVRAFVTAPNPITPPFAAVGPNEPYLDYSGVLMEGEINVRLQITVVARPGVNDVTAAEIDALILQVLDALEETDFENPHYFRVEEDGIGRPAQLSIGGQSHTACPIDVFKPVQRRPAA